MNWDLSLHSPQREENFTAFDSPHIVCRKNKRGTLDVYLFYFWWTRRVPRHFLGKGDMDWLGKSNLASTIHLISKPIWRVLTGKNK